MGDWNPNSVTVRGQETRFTGRRYVQAMTPNRAYAMRIKPGALAGGMSAIHSRIGDLGGTPGLALSLVTDLHPAVTYTDVKPGTDTGSTIVGMQDAAGATVNFGDVDDALDDTDYARNTNAVSANRSASVAFRGNTGSGGAGAFLGRRILSVRIGGVVMNRRFGVNNAAQVRVVPFLRLGGVDYESSSVLVPKSDVFKSYPVITEWFLNPATGLPWTITQLEAYTASGGTGLFGLKVYGKLEAQGFRISEFHMNVAHCLENRRGCYYRRAAPRAGYDRYPLLNNDLSTPNSQATLANTWYYAEQAPLGATANDYLRFDLPHMVMTLDQLAQDPADVTHEHRMVKEYRLTGIGGVGADSTDVDDTPEMLNLLFEAGGVIQSQSNPFGGPRQQFTILNLNKNTAANTGMQITTAGTVPVGGYTGLILTVGWEKTTKRPTQPLKIQVRHGVGAITGGGTLDAEVILDPATMVDGTPRDYLLTLPAFGLINTQYHISLRCEAPSGAGFHMYLEDTNSDGFSATSTLAQIQSASVNGAVDSYYTAGVANAQYDLSLALFSPPTGPSSPGVTGGVFTENHPYVAETDVAVPMTRALFTRVIWTPTTLGAAFLAYLVKRRRFQIPQPPWDIIGVVTVQAGYTPAEVEKFHRLFDDYEAGTAIQVDSVDFDPVASEYAQGYEYTVTVLRKDGTESLVGVTSIPGDVNPPPYDSWLVSNAAHLLNAPLRGEANTSSDPLLTPRVYEQVADRDYSIVRVSGNVPGRRLRLQWGQLGYVDESRLRTVRALATTGRQVALQRCRGTRTLGVLSEPSTNEEPGQLSCAADFQVTGDRSDPADYNAVTGVVFDETAATNPARYGKIVMPTTYDHNLTLSVVVAERFESGIANVFGTPTFGAADNTVVILDRGGWFADPAHGSLYTKGWYLAWRKLYGMELGVFWTGAGGTGYNITREYPAGNGPGSWGFYPDKAAEEGVWVLTSGLSATYFGRVWRDGVLVNPGGLNGGGIGGGTAINSSTSITNPAMPIAVAAANHPTNPSGFQGNGVHAEPLVAVGLLQLNVQLQAKPVQAMTRYLSGAHDGRMDSYTSMFYDFRDLRCWDGVVKTKLPNLGRGADNANHRFSDLSLDFIGSPAPMGIPTADLAELERRQ